jgi:hypothetical protein
LPLPAYNPTTGTPTVVETVLNTYLTTSLNGAIAANANTATLNSVAGLVPFSSWITVDTEISNPGYVEVVQVISISSNTVTVYPQFKYAHSTTNPVMLQEHRQIMSIGGGVLGSPYADVTSAGISGTIGALAIQGITGGVPINQQPLVFGSIIGNITASGSSNGVSANVINAGNCIISIHGTYVAAFTFECSDDTGTTWYPILGSRLQGYNTDQVTPVLTNSNQMWDFPTHSFTNIRVWSSTYTSGTAVIKISSQASALDPTPTITGHVSTGAQYKSVLTSASTTALTNISTIARGIHSIGFTPNGNNIASPVLTLYDESGTTGASADIIYATSMGGGQIISFGWPLLNGLTYSLSSALTAGQNIIINWNSY